MIRIIAADDEQYLRDALPNLVDWKSLGCSLVKVLKNGRELVEAIEVEKPDIVITDIRMPVMDGLEVCEFVHDNYPSLRVVVLSAYSDFSYARTAMKYDVTEYILKADVVEELPAAIERLTQEINSQTEPKVSFKESDKDLYESLCEYINLHYREEISLTEVAAFLHANPSYLSRLYKNKAGINVSDDIIRKRIEKAKECLMTDMKVNDVSEYVGFNDPAYFSRLFKKQTGVSPREYKKSRINQ